MSTQSQTMNSSASGTFGVKKILVALLIAISGVIATAAPASAESDYIEGYLISTDGLVRGGVSNMGVHWGSGCSVKIGHPSNPSYSATVTDSRADGMSVTVWRKYAAYGFNSQWKRIGYDDTSTSGGSLVSTNDYFCDTKGAWVAVCVKNLEPASTSTSSRCIVSYRQDNS